MNVEPIKLLLIAGARPNFMKIAPVIRAIERRPQSFVSVLVHTGQHYDEGMSDVFFRDLGIPRPDFHLNVGSGSHARQTAAIMCEFEPVLEKVRPHCAVVFGDVNSTLACAIVAKKLGFPVAHVEAGLRSGDLDMPEEINRIVTDSISDLFFVTEPSGVEHLRAEGKAEEAIHYVGHVMIDNLFHEVERLGRAPGELTESDRLKQQVKRYGVVTLHRPSNVDDEDIFRGILAALTEISADLPLIFPAHPRTKARIQAFGLPLPDSIVMTPPLGYREFLNIWRDAAIVLTDSGGLQEETTALGVPCLTLRSNTERPVTVSEGTNRLVGTCAEDILRGARDVLSQERVVREIRRPHLWDGGASERILDVLERAFTRS